jgi:purine-binding chemotaxis protein CheW
MAQTSSEIESHVNVRRFLTFRVAGRRYALPAAEIGEVIQLPAIARVPHSPAGLLGLTNLRGNVIPVASGRGLLGQAEGTAADRERAIVLSDGAPVALAVDAIERLIEVADEKLDAHSAEIAALPGEALRGAFRDTSANVIKILDLQPLLTNAFVPQSRRSETSHRNVAPLHMAEPALPRVKLLTFEVSQQEFGLPLEVVQEIASLPALTTAVPHADAIVQGVIGFRDVLLPLLSVRALLGLNTETPVKNEKMIVAHIAGAVVGLVVDRMTGLLAAADEELDDVPDILAARVGGESRIRSIYRGDGGRHLVPVLNTDELFKDDVMRKIEATRSSAQIEAPQPMSANTIRMLVFRLGAEEYGLPIEAVEEVLRKPDQVARLPKAPKFLEGVVNLRGDVVPVVDQRRRFNLPATEESSAQRLVVVHTRGIRAALIVDSVSEVLRTDDQNIVEPPQIAGQKNPLVRGVVNLQEAERLILMLDPSELLTRAEHSQLDKFASAKPPEQPPK